MFPYFSCPSLINYKKNSRKFPNSEKADANDAYTQISAGEACLVNEVDALFKVSSSNYHETFIEISEQLICRKTVSLVAGTWSETKKHLLK